MRRLALLGAVLLILGWTIAATLANNELRAERDAAESGQAQSDATSENLALRLRLCESELDRKEALGR